MYLNAWLPTFVACEWNEIKIRATAIVKYRGNEIYKLAAAYMEDLTVWGFYTIDVYTQ